MRRRMEEVVLVAAAPDTHCRSRTPPRGTTRPRIWFCEDSKVCTLLLVRRVALAAAVEAVSDNQCSRHSQTSGTWRSTSAS